MDIKNIGSKASNATAIAVQEFEAFKAERHAMRMRQTQEAPEWLLFCATHEGKALRLRFKLSPDIAEVEEVINITAPIRKDSVVASESNTALLQRRLELGAFNQCNHCGSNGIVFCRGCNTLSCGGLNEHQHRCPGCGSLATKFNSGISLPFSQPSAASRAVMNAGRKALANPVRQSKLLLEHKQTKLLRGPR